MFVASQQTRDNGEVVRAIIDEYKGKTYVSIRVWYKGDATGQLLPGKNGINIRLDEFPLLDEAVTALRHRIQEQATMVKVSKKFKQTARMRDEEIEERPVVQRRHKNKRHAVR